MEAHDGGFLTGGNGAIDGRAGERGQHDAAALAAGHGRVAVAAQVEIVGRRGQANAASGAQGIERQFHQRRGIAVQHPNRILGRRDPHARGLVAGAHAARQGKRPGVQFVDRAGVGRQHKDLGLAGVRQNHAGSGIQRDLLPQTKAVEIHDAHRPSRLVGHETVAVKARRLAAAAGHNSGRGKDECAPGHFRRGHCGHCTSARSSFDFAEMPAHSLESPTKMLPRCSMSLIPSRIRGCPPFRYVSSVNRNSEI